MIMLSIYLVEKNGWHAETDVEFQQQMGTFIKKKIGAGESGKSNGSVGKEDY